MSFSALTLKEIKSLMRDKAFLASLIITPIILLSLGGVESHAVHKAIKEEVGIITRTKTLVILEDKGNISVGFANALASMGNNINVISSKENKANPLLYLKEGYGLVIIIPKGFSKNISAGIPGNVKIYMRTKGISFSLSARSMGLSEALKVALVRALSKSLGVPMNLFLSPLRTESYVLIPSVGLLKSQEAQSLLWFPLTIGMIFLILVMIVAQLSALSMSFEREEKTLELLFSLPMPRSQIVLSKISGAFIVSLVEAVVFIFSMMAYLKMIGGAGGINSGPALKLIERPETLALLSTSLIVVLLFVSSLAMLLGSFGKDPRTSQTISSSVILPLALIAYFISFAGIPGGAAGYAIASLPVSTLVVSILAPLQGNSFLAMYSLIVNIIYMITAIYALIRFASGERLLIGFRTSSKRWSLWH